MPVSLTSKATTFGTVVSTECSRLQPVNARLIRKLTCPCDVNLKALDSRFFNTCCRRLISVTMPRGSCGSISMWNANWRASATWRKLRSTASRTFTNGTCSGSTVTVPDSILDRSRMSLIRFIKSAPAAWMFLENSTCL